MGHDREPRKLHTPLNTTLKLIKTKQPEPPKDTVIQENLACISDEMQWLYNVISLRMNHYERSWFYDPANNVPPLHEIFPVPQLQPSTYREFNHEHELDITGRLLLAVALAASTTPEMFTGLFNQPDQVHSHYPPWGGMRISNTELIIPTLKTVLFLLTGNDKKQKSKYEYLLNENHPLITQQVIELRYADNTPHPSFDPALVLDPAFKNYFFTNIRPRLDHGSQFPAEIVETEQTFDDLIISDDLRKELEPLRDFIQTQEGLLSLKNSSRRFSPGYIVMFYGPPGTGKSMTAALLEKEYGVPVYKVKLSSVLSKYIGETEKNLERVFARLEGKNVILFFDEADALFGKRTEITDAKDRYANQEISYLLQRIEKWHGVVILATNFRQNLDTAFSRRINQQINFDLPEEDERLKLWLSIIPEEFSYESDELPMILAATYPFTGANIASTLKRASIAVLKQGTAVITKKILNPIIRDECMQNNMRQTYRPL